MIMGSYTSSPVANGCALLLGVPLLKRSESIGARMNLTKLNYVLSVYATPYPPWNPGGESRVPYQ